MKRAVSIAHCLLIAVWPVMFAFGISCLETYIRDIVSRTYDNSHYGWLILAYGISGVIFAVIGIYQKESLRRKELLIAYITAGALVVLAVFILLLEWNGIIPFSRAIYNTNAFLLSFVLGFTIYTAIKAIIFYRKQGK